MRDVERRSVDERRAAITALERRLIPFQSRWPRCSDAIRLIVATGNAAANRDTTNDAHAGIVLAAIAIAIESRPDTIDLASLAEQLDDVLAYGSCAQGRCTRLAQILFAMDKVYY